MLLVSTTPEDQSTDSGSSTDTGNVDGGNGGTDTDGTPDGDGTSTDPDVPAPEENATDDGAIAVMQLGAAFFLATVSASLF